jgi:hypothetical protein
MQLEGALLSIEEASAQEFPIVLRASMRLRNWLNRHAYAARELALLAGGR